MGHGDELAIVDGNFPAAALAQRLVYLSTTSAADALDAILTVFPLDTVAKPAALTMRVIGHPKDVPSPSATLRRCSSIIPGRPLRWGTSSVRHSTSVLATHSPSCEPPI